MFNFIDFVSLFNHISYHERMMSKLQTFSLYGIYATGYINKIMLDKLCYSSMSSEFNAA